MKDVSLITMNESTDLSQKKFNHQWTDDFFLLHIQLNNPSHIDADITVKRYFNDGNEKKESVKIKKEMSSHRFMISRSHPKEQSVDVFYGKALQLEAFKVDDRAFYPAKPFFVG